MSFSVKMTDVNKIGSNADFPSHLLIPLYLNSKHCHDVPHNAQIIKQICG